jgi:hypothetical protein
VPVTVQSERVRRIAELREALTPLAASAFGPSRLPDRPSQTPPCRSTKKLYHVGPALVGSRVQLVDGV